MAGRGKARYGADRVEPQGQAAHRRPRLAVARGETGLLASPPLCRKKEVCVGGSHSSLKPRQP